MNLCRSLLRRKCRGCPASDERKDEPPTTSGQIGELWMGNRPHGESILAFLVVSIRLPPYGPNSRGIFANGPFFQRDFEPPRGASTNQPSAVRCQRC